MEGLDLTPRWATRSHEAQVQFGEVRRSEGPQVKAPVVFVCLAHVCRNQPVGVVEAPRADAAVVELGHQAVTRDQLHHGVLAEELGRWGAWGVGVGGKTVRLQLSLVGLHEGWRGYTVP